MLYRFYNQRRLKKNYSLDNFDFWYQIYEKRYNLKFKLPAIDKYGKTLDKAILTDEIRDC